MRGRLVSVAGLLVLAAVAGGATLTRQQRDGAAWRRLFNGKDLQGWYTFLQKHGRDSDPTHVLSIKDDGVLHVYANDRNGDEVVMGYMGTNEQFSNYHLRLQYRWGKNQFKPRYLYKPDAGIYYHHLGEDVVWPQALQFQVELNGVGDLLTVGDIKVNTWIDGSRRSEDWQEFLAPERGGQPYETAGKGVTYTRKQLNVEQDGWNTVELICKGSAAAHIVNGHVVNRCENIRRQDANTPQGWAALSGGRILIEFEASEMYYRNIEIRLLDENETLDAAVAKATH
jgi:hypothetical protein